MTKLALCLTVAVALTVVMLSDAHADQPVFRVMNTSEQPPDGVWFRTAPDPSQTTRTTGVGVYMGEHVRVKCYWHGVAFGPYSNDVWYYAYDVERPSAAGRSNEGWINTHYVDDGQTADNPSPAVSQCATGSGDGGQVGGGETGGGGAGTGGGGGTGGGDPGGGSTPPSDGGQTPAAASPPIAVYYDPYGTANWEKRYVDTDAGVLNLTVNTWSTGKCGVSKPAYNAAVYLNPNIVTLAGWSLGRTGPIYFLAHASDAQKQAIDYIVIIDPGRNKELKECNSPDAGSQLASWLSSNPNAHLVVISGKVTQKDDSKGIQELYFNDIRDRAKRDHSKIRSRVLTCNYSIEHDPQAYDAGKYWITHRLTTCPTLRENGHSYKPTAGWHP